MPRVQRADVQDATPVRAPGAISVPGGGELAGVGRAVEQGAGEVDRAYDALLTREDTLTRLQAVDALRQRYDELVTAERDGGANFGNSNAVRGFRESLSNEASTARGRVEFRTPQGRALYDQAVVQLQSQYDRFAVAQGQQEAQKLVDMHADKAISQFAAVAGFDPGETDTALTALDAYVAQNVAPAASPAATEGTLLKGRAAILQAVVSYYQATGDTKKARETLDDPRFAGALSPSARASLSVQLHAADIQVARKNAEVAARYARLKQRGMTDEQLRDPRVALALEGINLPAPQRTKLDEFREFVTARRALDPDFVPSAHDVNEIFEVDDERTSALFGKGATGLARLAILDRLDAWEAGTLTRRGFDELMSALTLAQEADQFGRSADLSPLTKRRLEKLGVDVSTANTAIGRRRIDALRDRLFAPRRLEGEVGDFDVGGAGIGLEFEAPAGGEALGAGEQDPTTRRPNPRVVLETMEDAVADADEGVGTPQEKMGGIARAARGVNYTMFRSLPEITGPVSSIRERVAHVPWLGRVLQKEEVHTLRQVHEGVLRSIATNLRTSPRLVDKERVEIMEDALQNLQLQFMTDAKLARFKVVGLDNVLLFVQAGAEEAIANPEKVSPDELARQTDILKTVKEARTLLGVPRANTPEELVAVVQQMDLQNGDYVVWRNQVTPITNVDAILNPQPAPAGGQGAQ